MESRIELSDITKREDVVHITVTAYSRISEERVGGNYRYSETFFNRHWRYKDGKLLFMNANLEWDEFTDRNRETDLVLAAVKAHGYL
ncbi:MAG: hypothetical protein WBM11_10540 [Terriglobales bacterium]